MSRSRNFGYSMNYESSKNALEQQTAALLAERRQLENAYQYRAESRTPVTPIHPDATSLTPIVHRQSQQEGKTQEVVDKLQ